MMFKGTRLTRDEEKFIKKDLPNKKLFKQSHFMISRTAFISNWIIIHRRCHECLVNPVYCCEMRRFSPILYTYSCIDCIPIDIRNDPIVLFIPFYDIVRLGYEEVYARYSQGELEPPLSIQLQESYLDAMEEAETIPDMYESPLPVSSYTADEQREVVESTIREEVDPSKICRICLDSPKTHVFVPCGHYCVCDGCATEMKNGQSLQCPVCRKNSSMIMRIYEI